MRISVDKQQELKFAEAGEIVGLIGVDCVSGDTLCSPGTNLSLEGIFLPEPVMLLEVETPSQFLGRIQTKLLSHRALLLASQTRDNDVVIRAEVPLAEMFGYSTELRWRSPPQASLSQGMATFSMEFAQYQKLPDNLVSKI